MPPVIQLTHRGTLRHDADLAELHRTFAARHCAKLTGFLEPALIDTVRAQIARGRFVEFAHGAIATELRMETGVCTGLLHFLANDPQLFRLVESVCGATGIRAFAGRVYRRVPGSHHHDSWHNDVDGKRQVGMSVNLSADLYEGGVFELRDSETEQTLATLPNVGFGDAILFRLSSSLEHRVSGLRGAFSKTAFAGWFYANLEFDAVLHDTSPE